MNIPIKMNKDFEKAMTVLSERYGEDFEILNGFHESQLNFSDFIDGFIDKKVADVSIDSNANASNKDVRSLLNEKGKSHDKLFAFNKMICIELNPQLAKAHRIRVGIYQYFFAALLSLVVIFAVKAIGVLLVTAMLITPAAAARNLASSYGKMVWLSLIIGMVSSVAGLFLSFQDWMQTSTGATIVLCSCVIFVISLIFRKKKRA